MKLKHLLPVCAMALPLCATAVPAYPGLLPCTMEDGTTIMIQKHGDEFFDYTTDKDGYLITTGAKGLPVYQLDANGARLKATSKVVQELREKSFNALPVNLQLAPQNPGPQRTISTDREGRTKFPTTGEHRFLVILLEYPDLKWSVDDPKAMMEDKFNGTDYHYMNSPGSLREYYLENSQGNFRPTFDIVGPILLPNTNAYYVGNNDDSKYDRFSEAVLTAARLADEQYGVDFSQYDVDGDGDIDNVILYYPGYGAADIPKVSQGGVRAIWPHAGSVKSWVCNLDGKRLASYCCFNELNGSSHWYSKDMSIAGIGAAAHEFGHVMGFPDLYDPNYVVNTTPGTWSVMDSGCYNGDGYIPCNHSAYERWAFRWIELDELEAGTTYNLDPLADGGEAKRLTVYSDLQNARNGSFIFESRKKEGWDGGLGYGGLLIWHVEYEMSTFSTNKVNSTASFNRCNLVTADGSANYRLGNVSSAALNAAWPQKINYITPDTEINLFVNYVRNFGPAKHYISGIAYDGETGVSSFGFDLVTEAPSVTTVMKEPFRLEVNEKPTNTIHLEWDEVPGASDYHLSVFRKTATGSLFYEQFLEEKSVGNVNCYDLKLTANKMDYEYHAFVRPVCVLPSTQTSNEVVFTPSQLKSGVNAVEDVEVEDAMPVIGLKGAIDAPASARVFTLTGAPAGRDNLAPGIYLVQVGTRTHKVIVK